MRTSPWFVWSLGAVFVFGLFVLGMALFRLQVLSAGDYREDQERQAMRRIRVPGMRGRILDCQGRVLAECRPSRCIQCDLEEFQRRAAITGTAQAVDIAVTCLAACLGVPRAVSAEDIVRHVRTKSALPLVVWEDLEAEPFARFVEHASDFPGFEENIRPERIYPYGSLAAHVLGYTGRGVPDADPAAPVHFEEQEMKGREGTEGYYNRFLQGVSGERHIRVDARGFRPTRARQEQLEPSVEGGVAPSDGLDMRLTLDITLQAAVERTLKDQTGACVVLDPRDGAVRAMASAPTYDPNDCVPRLSAQMYAMLTNAPAKRGQNRAISEAYAPGSTFKPITALAALSAGWGAEDEYDCVGVYRLGNMRLHCWDRWGHGPVNVRDALKFSCNAFFCNLGTAVGTNAVISAARAFGLVQVTGLDLGGEVPGVVPDDEWKRRNYNEPWYPGDVCQMSIGQGMLLVTPLQMAVVAAALANGGDLYRPYLHEHDRREGVKPVGHVPFPAADIALVRQGMRDVAETGTGKRILTRVEDDPSVPPWKRGKFRLRVSAAGKTGTAEIGRGATRRKNTWVIAFAPFEAPTLAVAMIVERGESGGSTVAPRVYEVFRQAFGEEPILRGGRP